MVPSIGFGGIFQKMVKMFKDLSEELHLQKFMLN